MIDPSTNTWKEVLVYIQTRREQLHKQLVGLPIVHAAHSDAESRARLAELAMMIEKLTPKPPETPND